MPKSVLLIAGDVSGDIHTALLAQSIRQRHPEWSLHVLGGAHLQKAVADSPGSHSLGDTSGCSAIGIVTASKVYLRCRVFRDDILKFLKTHRVDAVVLCDWGGFNARMLPYFHRLGLPVLYYFPPGSWQRTGSAGLGIARYVTRVATPFSWSAERLNAVGCRADWVGHPLFERVRTPERKRTLRAEFGAAEDQPLIALLPGSRRSEIQILAPCLAETAALLQARRPMHFVAVVPATMEKEARARLPEWISVVTDRTSDLLLACDLAIVKTGTATLEAVIAGAPQVAVYDFSLAQRVEWCLLWLWKRIPFIAMPNIILQRMAVPELLVLNCRPEKIAPAVESILNDETVRARMRSDYAEICRVLGSDLPFTATERTAEILDEMIEETATKAPAAQPA